MRHYKIFLNNYDRFFFIFMLIYSGGFFLRKLASNVLNSFFLELINIEIFLSGCILILFFLGFYCIRALRVPLKHGYQVFCYSLGVSVALIFFSGLILNGISPFFSISSPLHPETMNFFFLGELGILFSLSLLINQNCTIPMLRFPSIGSWIILWSFFLILLSVTGAIICTKFTNPSLIFIFLLCIGLTVFIVLKKRKEPTALAITLIGISLGLVLHSSLISFYPQLWAVDSEFQNLVSTLAEGYWFSGHSSPINGCLSITLLGPILSGFLGIDPIWLLKVVYPIIFSIIPVVLFFAYSRQFDIRLSFLACFFLVSSFYFYGEGLLLRRQVIALLFFSLLLLVILENNLNLVQKSPLLLIFLAGLALSHYSSSYIFLFIVFFAFVFFLIYFLSPIQALIGVIRNTITRTSSDEKISSASSLKNNVLLRAMPLFFFFVCMMGWYLYISNGAVFSGIVSFGDFIQENLADFLDTSTRNPLVSSATGMDFDQSSLLGKVFRTILLFIEGCILIGFFKSVIDSQKHNLEFICLAFGSLSVLLLGIVIPYLSIGLSISRFYFVTLEVLAPFCVIGVMQVFRWLVKILPSNIVCLKKRELNMLERPQKVKCSIINPYFGTACILLFFFLFNSGIMYQAFMAGGDEIRAIDLPISQPMNYGHLDTSYYSVEEVAAVTWMSLHSPLNVPVFSDAQYISSLMLVFTNQGYELRQSTLNIKGASAFFQKAWNMRSGKVHIVEDTSNSPGMKTKSIYQNLPLRSFIDSKDQVYANGGSIFSISF